MAEYDDRAVDIPFLCLRGLPVNRVWDPGNHEESGTVPAPRSPHRVESHNGSYQLFRVLETGARALCDFKQT